MCKAMREAKTNTNWTDPNEEYERATLHFVQRLLAPENPWWKEFEAFQSRVALFGRYNSLSQVLLKMTCPGVPDFYQGTELWDFNLVDPDNRRPVDYGSRSESLAKVKKTGLEESKLFVIWRTLQFRKENRELFERGEYVRIAATTEHVCAFAREWNGRRVIVVAPRLIYTLCGGKLVAPVGAIWKDATLETEIKDIRNVFTGETISTNRLADILKTFPIALLASR